MNRKHFLPLCSIALTALLLASCRIESYDAVTEAQLMRMAPFQATLLRIEDKDLLGGDHWIAAYFKAADGRHISIGGTKASAEMTAFIRSLHKRQTVTLPDSFSSFQKSPANKK